jgi:3-dehydroquinate synthase
MLEAAPATPVKLEVNAGGDRSTILIGDGLSERLASLLDETGIDGRRFVVSNPTIWKLHRNVFERISTSEPILIADGERHKTLQTTGRIYDALIRAEADRASAIVAVGGGVVGDVAGFAAATYLRGITLVQVPTTLLAQVDSAIGGKVGVNHSLGKNLIGAFHQAALVAIDPLLLKTLPRREFRSGLYEVVKYGMIASRELFDRVAHHSKAIFARDPEVLLPAIAESCRIKAEIVSADERESGLRRVLNYGHTIGHALESVTKYRRFRHGEAIAYGMMAAANLAAARGALAPRDRQALADLVALLGPLPAVNDLSAAHVIEAVRRDKKVLKGRLHFVICIAVGATTVVDDVTEDELVGVLRAMGLKA